VGEQSAVVGNPTTSLAGDIPRGRFSDHAAVNMLMQQKLILLFRTKQNRIKIEPQIVVESEMINQVAETKFLGCV